MDTTHVRKVQGRWLPAQSRAYAIISVRDAQGRISRPIPVFLFAGKTLPQAVGLKASEEIYTAIACTRSDFLAAVQQFNSK